MSFPHSESIDRLFDSFLSLKNREEYYQYFEDLCTVKEVLSMAQRLDVAHLLSRGDSYLAITDETGVSSATVGRVKRCLDYGSGGYRTALDRLSSEED